MGKRKKPLPPKVKRMNRTRRLASARFWLPKYSGKSVLRSYCKHFGVDWRCAAVELAALGISIDPAYLSQREKTENERSRKRKERLQQLQAELNVTWLPHSDLLAAHCAGNFEALYSDS